MPTSAEPIARIGFVGLGRMGTPMVANLVRAGFAVMAVDISSEARDRAQAVGATTSADLAELAGVIDALVLMLPDSNVVEAVVSAAQDAGALTDGLLLADMSSSQPARTRQLASEVAAHGVRMIDAPVSGGVGGAELATLTIMVGGDEADVEAARPFLSALGKVVPAGPIGAGHAVKALNNLLSATHLWITGEAMAAGERFGLDPAVMLEIFNSSSGRSGSTEKKWPQFVLPGTYDSGFQLQLMLKDMKIAVELCEDNDAFSALGAEAVRLWSAAADELPDSADHTEIARWITAKGVR